MSFQRNDAHLYQNIIDSLAIANNLQTHTRNTHFLSVLSGYNDQTVASLWHQSENTAS